MLVYGVANCLAIDHGVVERRERPRMIVDCPVNIWEDLHLMPLFEEKMRRIRPGGMGLKAGSAG
ncbi:MAG: hypothetical protein R3349_02065 [Geminicoccaceae bacterium]|nr:hypothetical protein [Geminicoccaceae bacterium]